MSDLLFVLILLSEAAKDSFLLVNEEAGGGVEMSSNCGKVLAVLIARTLKQQQSGCQEIWTGSETIFVFLQISLSISVSQVGRDA